MSTEHGVPISGQSIRLPEGDELYACFQKAYSHLSPDDWANICRGLQNGEHRYMFPNETDRNIISYGSLLTQLLELISYYEVETIITHRIAVALEKGFPDLIRELARDDESFVVNAINFIEKLKKPVRERNIPLKDKITPGESIRLPNSVGLSKHVGEVYAAQGVESRVYNALTQAIILGCNKLFEQIELDKIIISYEELGFLLHMVFLMLLAGDKVIPEEAETLHNGFHNLVSALSGDDYEFVEKVMQRLNDYRGGYDEIPKY